MLRDVVLFRDFINEVLQYLCASFFEISCSLGDGQGLNKWKRAAGRNACGICACGDGCSGGHVRDGETVLDGGSVMNRGIVSDEESYSNILSRPTFMSKQAHSPVWRSKDI